MAGDLSRDFLAAIDRLVAGKATCPELVGRPVSISVSTVALEAGHSRNNLYRVEYEAIRDKIREVRTRRKKAARKPKTRDELEIALRAEIAALEAKVAKLGTENMRLFHLKLQAEARVARLLEKLRRNDIDLAAALQRRKS